MRTRLCIQPVAHNWRMPASTIGKPVRPRCQARKLRRVAGPLEALEAPIERLQHRVRKVVDQVVRELAPQQL